MPSEGAWWTIASPRPGGADEIRISPGRADLGGEGIRVTAPEAVGRPVGVEHRRDDSYRLVREEQHRVGGKIPSANSPRSRVPGHWSASGRAARDFQRVPSEQGQEQKRASGGQDDQEPPRVADTLRSRRRPARPAEPKKDEGPRRRSRRSCQREPGRLRGDRRSPRSSGVTAVRGRIFCGCRAAAHRRPGHAVADQRSPPSARDTSAPNRIEQRRHGDERRRGSLRRRDEVRHEHPRDPGEREQEPEAPLPDRWNDERDRGGRHRHEEHLVEVRQVVEHDPLPRRAPVLPFAREVMPPRGVFEQELVPVVEVRVDRPGRDRSAARPRRSRARAAEPNRGRPPDRRL